MGWSAAHGGAYGLPEHCGALSLPHLLYEGACRRTCASGRRDLQVVRTLPGARRRELRDRGGQGACAGRRERRRQVDAGQDRHRHHRRPTRARSLLDGEPVRFATPIEARRAGVAAVYQDPKLFPHLDVAENITMGDAPVTALGTVDRKAMYARAQASARAARRRGRPAGADRRPVGRRAAVRRDRPGADRRPAAADPRRADLGADAGGGGEALPHRPRPARPRARR